MTRYRWDPVHYSSARRPSPDLRTSDAERHRATDLLSRHFAEGRLDQAEFDLRVSRATGAVTRADLDGLFGDLPRLDEEPAAPRPRSGGRGLLLPVVVALVFLATLGHTVWDARVPWLLVAGLVALVWVRSRRAHRARPDELGR
jgi:hypothetical protein